MAKAGREPLHLEAPVFTGSQLLPHHTLEVLCMLTVDKGEKILQSLVLTKPTKGKSFQ